MVVMLLVLMTQIKLVSCAVLARPRSRSETCFGAQHNLRKVLVLSRSNDANECSRCFDRTSESAEIKDATNRCRLEQSGSYGRPFKTWVSDV
jgi:hypothetical protein